MRKEYTSNMSFYVKDGQLPLAVFFVDGDHPDKLFHDHKFLEVVIIVKGELLHLVGDECCEVKRGDVLVIHPGVIHGYDKAAGAGILNLIYNHDELPLPPLDSGGFMLSEIFFPDKEKLYNSAKPVVSLSEDELQRLIEIVSRIDDEVKSIRPGAMFSSLALLMEALILIFRAGSLQISGERPGFMIGSAINYMNKHFFEPVTLKKLAEKACMSERSFQRHFRQTVGCTPMEYLMEIRLRNVQTQLITSDIEIGTIALNCGFYDSNYMCKKFKQAFNLTPSEFRAGRGVEL